MKLFSTIRIFSTIATWACIIALAAAPSLAFGKGKRKSKKKAKPAATAPERPTEKTEAPAPPPPVVPVTNISDEHVLNAKTVAVQPVFMVGAHADTAWSAMSEQIAMRKPAGDTKSLLDAAGAIAAPKKSEGGFGFAGASSADDIKILRYGLAAGLLPVMVKYGATKRANALAGGLDSSAALLGKLTKETQASAAVLRTLGKSGKAGGKLLGMLYATAIRSGMVGIAKGPQRGHGYYITGVWASGAVLVASLGGSSVWADMGEPIAVLLDKDAAFGGSDRVLARHVRAIAAEVRKDAPDAKKIMGIVAQMNKVEADKPAAAAPAADAKAAAPAADAKAAAPAKK